MAAVIFTAQTDCIKLFSLTTKVPFFANATIAFMFFILPMTLRSLEPFEPFEEEQLYLAGMVLIGHFRVPKTLTFKTRLGAQPFLRK